MLDDYIKELIESNNRVIIPNFGAFLLRATSKNKNKKDLAAKVEDIYFSPFLKFNDELLVNHIMKKEDVDQKAAMDKINDYIKEIEESVAKDGKYSIAGLGEFSQDNQGKIQFQVAPGTSKAGTSEKKKTEKPAEEGKKAEAPKDEEKKTPESKAKTLNEKAAQTKKTQTAKPAEEKKTEPPKKTASKETTAEKKSSAPTGKTGGSRKTPPPTGRKKSRSGTNKGLVLSIAIGVPVAVVFIWAMLNFDTVEGLFSKKDKKEKPVTEKVDKQKPQKKQEKPTEKQSDDTKAETQKAPEQQAKPQETKKETQPQVQQKKFYIVAGSFKKKQNAVNFRENLIKQGYNSELIGERNGMHAVSYASFQNKAKAESELKKLREKGIQAWLLYYYNKVLT